MAALHQEMQLSSPERINIALITAQNALDAFGALEKAVFSAIKDFIGKVLDSVIDIQVVEFKGMIMADKPKTGGF